MVNKCIHCKKEIGPLQLVCEDCSKRLQEAVDKSVDTIAGSPVKEEVNHPTRYGGDTTYECIKVLKNWLSPDEYKGFLRGNAIKYICRLGKKDECKQEINKAIWYLQKLSEEF